MRRVFAEFHPALMQHLMKEERVLFPMLRQLDDPNGERAFHCGSVGNPIGMMLKEHDEAARGAGAVPHPDAGLHAAGGRLQHLPRGLARHGRIGE